MSVRGDRRSRDPGRLALRWPAAALGAFLLAACGSREGPEAEKEEESAIVQEKERGPVEVTLRVEPREPSFAERIQYSIRARAVDGVEVTLPSPGENLGNFIIRDFVPARRTTPAPGAVEWQQSYVLEVLTSGEYTIPETTIRFVDRRQEETETEETETGEGASGPGEEDPPGKGAADPERESASEERVFKILTDPIQIEVKSLESAEALEDLRPIEGPVEPPLVPPSFRWPLIALGSLAGCAALVFLALKLRRRKLLAPPPIPPAELAYRELEWLLRQDFPGRGELKEFFFHVSRIVREYIERRFGLRAPEQTTEEFLDVLARSDSLDSRHKELLERFLEKADLVKFARYAPANEEVEASFAAARDFIAETRERREEASVESR